MKSFVLLLLCAVLVSAQGTKQVRRDIPTLTKELELLKGYLESARDSLQSDVNSRWTKKQRYINHKEADKEEMAELRTRQEQVTNTLAALKEECFTAEGRIDEEKKAVQKKKDEWDFFTSSIDDIYEKESKLIEDQIPFDMEKNRVALDGLRREYQSTKQPAAAIDAAMAYYNNKIDRAGKITIGKDLVMPDDGDPTSMNVVRFGDLFAYAVDNGGKPFAIRQTGKMGMGRYTIEPIGSVDLATNITTVFPQWFEGKQFESVTFDVLQNQNSDLLLAGKKVDKMAEIRQFFINGGPVMIPLAGLSIWALILFIMKFIQYSRKDKGYNRIGRKVVDLLKENKRDEALEFAKKQKGVVAKVVIDCLEHSQWNRSSAEKAVKERLLEEVPKLNRSLPTMSVIGAAAPLLGLLGTVSGMISLFATITHYGTGDPKMLAGGISIALITTQAGLSIAIPCVLLHNYLRNRSNHMMAEMQKHSFRILNRLWPVEG